MIVIRIFIITIKKIILKLKFIIKSLKWQAIMNDSWRAVRYHDLGDNISLLWLKSLSPVEFIPKFYKIMEIVLANGVELIINQWISDYRINIRCCWFWAQHIYKPYNKYTYTNHIESLDKWFKWKQIVFWPNWSHLNKNYPNIGLLD